METQTARRLSRIVSYVLNPLVVPTIAVLILMFGDTVMGSVPLQFKWFFVGIVALNTLFIPGTFIGVMRSLKIVSDLELSERKERVMPMVVVIICYLLCGYMLLNVKVAFLLSKFVYSAIGCVALAFVVNFFWKISLHMVSAGGLVAMLLVMNVSGFGHLMWWLVAAVLLSGALGSARLYLGCHNLTQVLVGFLCGFIVVFAGMLFF